MPGPPTTSGLSAKRGSCEASGTIKVSLPMMAWPQNEMSRAVSRTSSPIQDLNHWRSSSTRLTSAIGTSNTRRAMRVSRSNRSSASVSSKESRRRVSSRNASSGGIGASSIGYLSSVIKPIFSIFGFRKVGGLRRKQKAARLSGFFRQAGEENYFFFLALAFGRSVMEPSNTSAARPTDSCRVG